MSITQSLKLPNLQPLYLQFAGLEEIFLKDLKLNYQLFSIRKFAWRSVKKLSKLDFIDFYYCAEQKFVSLATSLFENPVRSVELKPR